MIFFSEQRLINHANLAQFGLTSKPVNTRGQILLPSKSQGQVSGGSVIQAQQTRSFNTVKNGASQAQMQTLALSRAGGAKTQALSDLRSGRITNDEYNARIDSASKSQDAARRLLGTYGQPLSNAQKADVIYKSRIAASNDAISRAMGDAIARGESVDQYEWEDRRAAAENAILAEQKHNAQLNANQAVRLGKAKQGYNPATSSRGGAPRTASIRQPFGNRTSAAGIAANKSGVAPTRTQRLGLTPRTGSGGYSSSSTGTAPATVSGNAQGADSMNASPLPSAAPTDIPSEELPTYTNRQAEAAGALDSDTVDAPKSLKQITAEEQAALDPMLAAQQQIRNGFKIYQSNAQSLMEQRGQQIEQYKTDSQGRSEQVADLKISQSKQNRDLQLELINDARERARRDQLLAQEKTDRDYDREEERIIGENTDRLEKLNTSLGARYGGFGSGKGLQKIDAARQEAQTVLRQLNEDKIYARQVDQNKLSDIEEKWSNDRKQAFAAHDTNVTAAYTKMVEEAQAIDDKVLTEEGDQTDAAISLLKTSFEQLDKIWSKTGDELTAANRRALDRRDAVRKEAYDHSQDAFKNMFTALSQLPSNSPLFNNFEKAAGLTPGTIGATKSNEERRIAISEGQYNLQQRQFQLDIAKFERDGNQIDHNASNDVGYLVTSDGKVFRDTFGNPVYLGGAGGSVTSSIGNDSKLFGDSTVGMNSTVSFSRYALSIGDLVPGSPYHKGGEYDIDNHAGTPIPAWMNGTVVKVNSKNANDPYGLYVDVSDGQRVTRYAHLQSVLVQEGQQVSGINSGQRQLIGVMGNTGNVLGLDGQHPGAADHETGSHLHLEVRNGTDFSTGKRIDAMNAGMQPGQMVSGKVTWVDQMRTKMRQGAGMTGTGSAITKPNLDTPWLEIDQSILDLAKDTFRDSDGKTDWKAVGIVFDYMTQNKMGNYQLSYDGKGAIEGIRQASKEAAYTQQTRNRNTTQDRGLLTSGIVQPEDFYGSLTDGTLAQMSEAEAAGYMRDMGYIVEPGRLWGHNIREMTSEELAQLNEQRKAAGLSPIQ